MSDGISPFSGFRSFEKSAVSNSQNGFGDLNSVIENLGNTHVSQPSTSELKMDSSSGTLSFNSKEAYLAQQSLEEIKRKIEAEKNNIQANSMDVLMGKVQTAEYFDSVQKELKEDSSDDTSNQVLALSQIKEKSIQVSLKALAISASALEVIGKSFIDLIPSGKELIVEGIFGASEKSLSPEEKQAQAKKMGIIRSFFQNLSASFQEMVSAKMSQIHGWLKSAGLEGADRVLVNTLRKLSNTLVEDIHRLGINEAGRAKSEQEKKKEEQILEASTPTPVSAFLNHKLEGELRGGGQHFSDAVG